MMTNEQEATFRTLYASGATWQEIGHEVGIDPSWLSVQRKRLGIPERPSIGRRVRWNWKMEAELRAMFPTTAPYVMAKHFGVSIDAVKNKMHAMGLVRVVEVPVDTYTGSPRWFRDQAGVEPLPAFHPIAAQVLGLSA